MEKQKILILDDDLDIGMMMKMMLQFKDYDVALFTTPDKIEEEISNQPYDLIFVDMLLSGRNGIDICKALKSNPAVAVIPLIMMSAHPDAKQICLAAGVDDFIAKPFEVKEVLLKVAGLLENVKE
ncbi:two-component system response regulator [Ferruginibacter sp.]|uniref:response regulator n=1 Tax=Ferruginibacter sp. TaxID=1940288 RepID=UPI0019B19379|nr:response regulator [Ferruginibacter sp.]MBC7625869.1 response regulator [Ferruginibacter sp.]